MVNSIVKQAKQANISGLAVPAAQGLMGNVISHGIQMLRAHSDTMATYVNIF